MDDKQFFIKNETIKIIKKLGKRKPARVKKPVVEVGGVSSQYFAETEVLAKNYANSKSIKVRETLQNLCER